MNPKLEEIYKQIPSSKCKENCGLCCGLVWPSDLERSNIRLWCLSKGIEYKDFDNARGDDCHYLLPDKKCQIYPVRPFLCRILGVCTEILCPINGVKSDKKLNRSQGSFFYKKIYLQGKQKQKTLKHRGVIMDMLSAMAEGDLQTQ